MVQFLFRKSESDPVVPTSEGSQRRKKASKQWTNKVAGLIDETCVDSSHRSGKGSDPESVPVPLPAQQTSVRLEGPYFTPVNPASYNTVICLVAGTGISGAVAIAAAFSAQSALNGNVLKEQGHSGEVSPSKEKSWRRCIIVWSIRETDYIMLPFFQDTPGLEVRPHLTGQGRPRIDLRRTIDEIREADPNGSTWVYLSGPNAFLEAGKKACQASNVEFFSARWT